MCVCVCVCLTYLPHHQAPNAKPKNRLLPILLTDQVQHGLRLGLVEPQDVIQLPQQAVRQPHMPLEGKSTINAEWHLPDQILGVVVYHPRILGIGPGGDVVGGKGWREDEAFVLIVVVVVVVVVFIVVGGDVGGAEVAS